MYIDRLLTVSIHNVLLYEVPCAGASFLGWLSLVDPVSRGTVILGRPPHSIMTKDKVSAWYSQFTLSLKSGPGRVEKACPSTRWSRVYSRIIIDVVDGVSVSFELSVFLLLLLILGWIWSPFVRSIPHR